MRRAFIAGNWKLNTLPEEGATLITALAAQVANAKCDIGVAPPATGLAAARTAIDATGASILLGAQNVHWAEDGAFTGELSAAMLKDVGCDFAIVGHSERRQFFGDTDDTVNQRAKAAVASGLHAVVCVGESLAEREADETTNVVTRQIKASLADLDNAHITVAYEPVWAIGTGLSASPEQAQEVHALIRGLLADMFGSQAAEAVRIQYGGSVKPGNVDELMSCADVDGALVGGASLKADDFARIVNFKL